MTQPGTPLERQLRLALNLGARQPAIRRIGEVDAAVRCDDHIVGAVQLLALVVRSDRLPRTVDALAHHRAGHALADNQVSALPARGAAARAAAPGGQHRHLVLPVTDLVAAELLDPATVAEARRTELKTADLREQVTRLAAEKAGLEMLVAELREHIAFLRSQLAGPRAA